MRPAVGRLGIDISKATMDNYRNQKKEAEGKMKRRPRKGRGKEENDREGGRRDARKTTNPKVMNRGRRNPTTFCTSTTTFEPVPRYSHATTRRAAPIFLFSYRSLHPSQTLSVAHSLYVPHIRSMTSNGNA